MPFIRHTRDKRGYENTYVMHAYRPTAQEPNRTRVLYLFRSPAHLRIGRQALDPEVMEALEHTHPDLSFDWQALVREPIPIRAEAREPAARAPRPAHRPPPPVVVETPAVEIEDESLLGRTIGGVAAARLRQRYNDLLQRIGRRAQTPEERDRLTERARRLNPDEWPDEGAVRSGALTVEAEWDALAAELPSRRRGRRGGRRRSQAPPPSPVGTAPPPAGASGPAEASPGTSGIMDEGENRHAGPESTHVDRPNGNAGAPGDGSGLGTADVPDDPTDTGFPIDD